MTHYPNEEVWLPINTNLEKVKDVRPNLYYVSNYGKVKKLGNNGSMTILSTNQTRPISVSLLLNGEPVRTRHFGISTLVAMHFMYRDDYMNHIVLHVDGDEYNNSLCNLIWDDGFGANQQAIMCDYAVYNLPSLPGEQWYPMPCIGEYSNINNTGLYISSYGRLYSTIKGKFLGSKSGGGYMVSNSKEFGINSSKTTGYPIHRVVINTFDPIENSKAYQVNHIDGDKINNNIDNLEWVTPQGNVRHAYANSLNHMLGERHSESKYSRETVFMLMSLILQGYSAFGICAELQSRGITDKDIAPTFINDLMLCRCRIIDICDYLVSIGYPTLETIIPPEILTQISNDVKSGISRFEILHKYKLDTTPLLKIAGNLAYQIYKDDKFWYAFCNTVINPIVAQS